MAERPVGDIDARQAEFAGEKYSIYMLKDSTYTLQLAANYGRNIRTGPTKRRRHPKTNILYEFQYSEPIAHYYQGRHAADDVLLGEETTTTEVQERLRPIYLAGFARLKVGSAQL